LLSLTDTKIRFLPFCPIYRFWTDATSLVKKSYLMMKVTMKKTMVLRETSQSLPNSRSTNLRSVESLLKSTTHLSKPRKQKKSTEKRVKQTSTVMKKERLSWKSMVKKTAMNHCWANAMLKKKVTRAMPTREPRMNERI